MENRLMSTGAAAAATSSPDPLYILGAGMHPWGKWGNDFTEYGVAAARAALSEAGLDWRQIRLVAGADTIRNGYPGFVAGSTFAQKLGWNGVPVSSSYAACASGSQALQSARAQILAGFCDVALVIGADTTPQGFFAPVGGERRNDPDWQRFHLIGATNTVYFALLARRRMDLYGATLEDFAAVKVKNAKHGLENPNARYRKETSVEDVLASPVVSDPLRLLDICATSDGAAALIVASAEFTKKHLGSLDGVPSVRAVSTVTPKYPQHLPELPDIATDSTAVVAAPDRVFKDQILDAAYAEAGIGPEDLTLAEVYDLSTALELDWYEHLGLCPKGEAEQLLRGGATTIGGRIPVNPSGGLACFGEAVPAQAIAQVCELTWQLRGQATGRQVEGATVGVTANQGLFGHGSSVIVAR
jgi:acetyl-CoA acetyltransferase